MMSSNMLRRMLPLFVLSVTALLVSGCGDSVVDGDSPPEQPEGEFTLFTTGAGLVDNWVTGMLVDYTRGGVWFATVRGISFHSSIDSTWTSWGAESSLPSLEVNSLAIDYANADIWAGTASGSAFLSDDFWLEAGIDSLVNRYVTSVNVISGELWVGTRGGMSIRSSDGWRTLTDPLGLLNRGVTAIAVDAPGNVWIGTPEGIAVHGDEGWSYFGISELPHPVVNAIFRDQLGRMWVGAPGGIGMYDGISWRHYTVADGLPAPGVNGFTEARDHVIWAATDDGPAFLTGERFKRIVLPGTAEDAVVTSVAVDLVRDDIWFGTMAGAVRLHK